MAVSRRAVAGSDSRGTSAPSAQRRAGLRPTVPARPSPGCPAAAALILSETLQWESRLHWLPPFSSFLANIRVCSSDVCPNLAAYVLTRDAEA